MKSREIEKVVVSYLGKKYSDVNLAASAKKLSDSFIHLRDKIPLNYLSDRSFRAAYISNFLIVNAVKVACCLYEAKGLGIFSDMEKCRVLDLGCGPGTASLAISTFFQRELPETILEITGVDCCSEVLSDASELFEVVKSEKHTFIPARKAPDGKKFDIIIASNLLNEMAGNETKFCKELINKNLSKNGFLIVIDPALRNTSRAIMDMRDVLVKDKIAHAYAPCLHQNPCPMLAANLRDWCHFYVEWKRPSLIEDMDKIIGTDRKFLPMSYLIVGKKPLAGNNDNVWRITSSPLISKGKREFVMCGKNGKLKKISRLDRDLTSDNSAFDETKRGDIVKCDVENRVGKTDKFKIVKNFNFHEDCR